jgi:hypothetical protein
MPGNFCGMLITESVNGLKSYGLNDVDETIANHIDLDRQKVRTERVLENGHLNSAPRNTFLPIFHSIVLWRLGVE